MVGEVTESLGAPTTLVPMPCRLQLQWRRPSETRRPGLDGDDIAARIRSREPRTSSNRHALRWSEPSFGRIVTVGTNLFQNLVVTYHDYTAAKAALLSLTRTAAAELGRWGWPLNMVSGGLCAHHRCQPGHPQEYFRSRRRHHADAPRDHTRRRRPTPCSFSQAPGRERSPARTLIVDGGLVFG